LSHSQSSMARSRYSSFHRQQPVAEQANVTQQSTLAERATLSH